MTGSSSYLRLGVYFLFAVLLVSLVGCSGGNREGVTKVLVFSKTEGYKHSSIPNGIAAIKKMGREHGFIVDASKNSGKFTSENLDQYAAVIFLNTTGDVLDSDQEKAFERYIQAGGGFVGVHSATDTEYGWSWYGKLVGAYFKSHPHIQEARFLVKDSDFIATDFFMDSVWVRTDELYNFKNLNPNVDVLITIDESSYEGGENGDHHPMSWYHEYDGGRAFYTALGHTEECYEEEKFLKHLLGGINYAIGEKKKLDYSKATTQYAPDQKRFTKTELTVGKFYEPTEMTILPNNDVLIAQRRGELMLYKNDNEELMQVGYLDVYHESGVENVNAEEGFMGLQKDPDYENNNWIYCFYSPKGDEWVNRLSRFKFQDESFDMSSEQIILDVESQRGICCHTGGSIAFGPDGLLYLSTGDNTTPFDEPEAEYVNNGFAPLNDLPGKKQYDARRSSGNTNDLRGKILRIKVNEDGTYDIPEGNLFPPGTPNTRPEIYTMGHRNPYRISVDPKNGYVYWGDVGPDSNEDDWEARGPRGYDEMNQAREAGNFGWPLFIADNKPYKDYDYSNGETGNSFDPANPFNDSKNNTGLRELPPAQPAYVYYDYEGSDLHNQVGSGGRNAMAGPVFYKDLYGGKSGLPDYYDGKVIIYDWMRGWMKAVTLWPNGEFRNMEPFAPRVDLNNLIDMELSPEGTLYLLEYGSGWFTKNDDSALSYLTFNAGNQPPEIVNVEIDRSSGGTPLTITMKVDAIDAEDDPLTYLWDMGNGETIETTEPSLTYTFEEPGTHKISVEVMDGDGMKNKSETITVVSGNTLPIVSLDIKGANNSFFMPGLPIEYEVDVTDVEDDQSGIDPSRIHVAVDYLDGFDEASLSMGHLQVSDVALGESLTQSLDCKTCHKPAGESIGPSYTDVAMKYADDEDALSSLPERMKAGSSGTWGENVMPAHPNLSNEDARRITQYILSLNGQKKNTSLPPSGTIIPDEKYANKIMVITASYTDGGAEGTIPLTGVKKVALKSAKTAVNEAEVME